MPANLMDSVLPISGDDCKIHSRIGHITVKYNNFIIVWGGYEDQMPSGGFYVRRANYHPPEELLLYDTEYEIWHLVMTSGEVPPKLCGSTAAICGDHLYLYGGYCDDPVEEGGGNVNTLYRLSLSEMEWRQLHPAGLTPLTCDKLVSWSCSDAVYILGGFGPRPPDHQYADAGVEFAVDVRSGDLRGWISQLVVYRPSENRWHWPQASGRSPCPRAAHAAALVGDFVYVFGGRMNRRLNDLYRLHLTDMHWEQIAPSEPGVQGPQGRSWHSLTTLGDHQLLLYGGFNNHEQPLDDPWLLDTQTHRWSPAAECCVPRAQARMWHAAAAGAPGEVVVVGGISSSILAPPPASYATELVVVRNRPRLCLDTVEAHWPTLESGVWLLPLPVQERVHARLRARRSTSSTSGTGSGTGSTAR